MKNKYEIRGDVTAIFVKCKGEIFEALIDTEDLDKVNVFPNTWYIRSGRYVYGMFNRKNPHDRGITWTLHRYLLNCPKDMVVDHINRNILDNRKENLRIVTRSENNQNVGSRRDTLSGVRGVTWDKHKNKWKSSIKVGGKTKFLGLYSDLEDAKRVSEEARLKNMPYSQEATEGIAFTGIEKKLKKEKQKKAFRHNKSSGKRGVSWHTQTQKWRVSIMIQKKIHYSFHNDLEEAIEAANKLIEYRNTLK